jgi:hypothetical protein
MKKKFHCERTIQGRVLEKSLGERAIHVRVLENQTYREMDNVYPVLKEYWKCYRGKGNADIDTGKSIEEKQY